MDPEYHRRFIEFANKLALKERRLLPLRRDDLLLLLSLLHRRRMGAAVRYIMPQRRSQLLAVVGEDLRVVCVAPDGSWTWREGRSMELSRW